MGPLIVSAFVPGLPVPQGSMRAYVGRNGRAYVTQGGTVDRQRRLAAWRADVRDTVAAALPADFTLACGPLEVDAAFGMLKPRYYPKKRRTWPIKARSGDVDKLARAVLDALTGTVWIDDAQVLVLTARKDYAVEPGLTVRVVGHEAAEAHPAAESVTFS